MVSQHHETPQNKKLSYKLSLTQYRLNMENEFPLIPKIFSCLQQKRGSHGFDNYGSSTGYQL